MPRYNPAEIEPHWQRYWETNRTFATADLPVGKKIYVLDMFPYPSGEGLHVGHPEGYTATDIVCRYRRMCGDDVLHPMGFDAFGLPAEEHAIRTGTPPRQQTEKNIETFTRQLKMLGFSYDWDRVLATTDREYFRWTQWIFLVLFDTWYDAKQRRGRPIDELPIPQEVAAVGETAIRRYQDKHRLAYQDDALVNWCPGLGTVLANEEVIDGRSERGSHPVQRIPLRQWMLRITAYADRLLEGLHELDWPVGIKKLQYDWIGRSTGAEVDFFIGQAAQIANWQSARKSSGFPIDSDDQVLRVYTTRPDTLYGATYMVIAPEHKIVEQLTTKSQSAAVEKYREVASRKSDRERTEGDKKKTGVFTGSYAINPVNNQPIQIWMGDYVLASYGTGAIMAVPAHDVRDFEFARTYNLPIIPVVDPQQAADNRDAVLAGEACFSGTGIATNSGRFDGTPTESFKQEIANELNANGLGRVAVNFKLRDWLFSRQRFWGEPFPIWHELDDNGKPTGLLRADQPQDLPIDLPELEDFKPHGRAEPPLDKAPASWLYATVGGKRYKRETNTMPQWAGSCWYYLRFIDPKNTTALVDPQRERAWMPVDLYVGGAEHAVLHLLYSRFWHQVLFDRGYVIHPEPFQRLINQGMILGEVEYLAYRADDGSWVGTNQVHRGDDSLYYDKSGRIVQATKLPEEVIAKVGDQFVMVDHPDIRVEGRAQKMSKSRGNVVNPDEIVRDYGADSLRLYEMFMGPLEATKPWSMAGVGGVRGFLDRAWRMIVDARAEEAALSPEVAEVTMDEEQRRVLHRTIKAVTLDYDSLGFNTAIARLMEFVNFFSRQSPRPQQAMETFVLLLSPMAPHISEELWRVLGHGKTLAYESWPAWDESALVESTLEIPVQINGKLRTKITVANGCDQATLLAVAKSNERVIALIVDKQIVKEIVIPGKLVNLVVK